MLGTYKKNNNSQLSQPLFKLFLYFFKSFKLLKSKSKFWKYYYTDRNRVEVCLWIEVLILLSFY